MNSFKNNHRRNRYKSNGDRSFRKRNGNGHKLNSDFNSGSEFRRRNPGRNNQNAGKLIEKYTELAREALSNGDKILSENYLQHADHFSRIINIQESNKLSNQNISQSQSNDKEKNVQDDSNKNEKSSEQPDVVD
tara:strand:+ start:373 stop:774 length:402 start_codon:yes stop_codon:yes gene_type:complete